MRSPQRASAHWLRREEARCGALGFREEVRARWRINRSNGAISSRRTALPFRSREHRYHRPGSLPTLPEIAEGWRLRRVPQAPGIMGLPKKELRSGILLRSSKDA
jgi:hypothetical protein